MFTYQGYGVFFTGYRPDTIPLIHNADIGCGEFTANCTLPNGLYLNKYTGQFYGIPTETESQLQSCNITLTQTQSLVSTVKFYILSIILLY